MAFVASVAAHSLTRPSARCFSLAPGCSAAVRRRRAVRPPVHRMSSATATAAATKTIPFRKYQGLGNDFILVDNRDDLEPCITADEARTWCDRHFGIGADGVIFLLPAKDAAADCGMRIFNSDGSEPEMCGNGIRCLARFAREVGAMAPHQTTLLVETLAGIIIPELESSGLVKVDMGEPLVSPPEDIPVDFPSGTHQADVGPVDGRTWAVTAVSMGNPHAVTFVSGPDEFVEVDARLEDIGSQVENFAVDGRRYFPAGMNVEFVEVRDAGESARVVVWERGAGRTMACGTGACGVVVAGVLAGRLQRRCAVELPGGALDIHWDEETNHVFMTGPADLAFVGEMPARVE